jgi:CBS domain-containing protein
MTLTLCKHELASEANNPRLTYIDRELSILEASRLMRNCGAEELLVTDQTQGELVPIGIVTARDIVTRIVAAGLDPAVLTAGDITWSGCAPNDEGQGAALRSLHQSNNHVLAIMHGDGRLAATVTLEDLLEALAHNPPNA